MKEISFEDIARAVADLAVRACCRLPQDMVDGMRKAHEAEPSPVGKNILEQLLENAAIAANDGIPICQDTGLPLFLQTWAKTCALWVALLKMPLTKACGAAM